MCWEDARLAIQLVAEETVGTRLRSAGVSEEAAAASLRQYVTPE